MATLLQPNRDISQVQPALLHTYVSKTLSRTPMAPTRIWISIYQPHSFTYMEASMSPPRKIKFQYSIPYLTSLLSRGFPREAMLEIAGGVDTRVSPASRRLNGYKSSRQANCIDVKPFHLDLCWNREILTSDVNSPHQWTNTPD
jgi:hypothetical protein